MAQFPGFADVEYLAEGGLGRVYRAVRESTGGVVAIKEIKQISVGSPAWHRARREVEALVRLKGHPHVVNVEEIITSADGNPSLVMELLDGGSADELIEAGPVPLDQAVRIGNAILSAIDASHAQGIIHRDLKPQNVLLGSFGQIKVCDFGIAGIARGEDHTQTSAATLAYASPEQIEDATIVGPPADVYSFCVTFLHIVNGTRPAFADRMTGRITLPPALIDTHPPLADLLARGMATSADDRPTVGELRTALTQAGRELDITSSSDPDTSAPRPPKPQTPPAADALVAASAGGPASDTSPTAVTGDPMPLPPGVTFEPPRPPVPPPPVAARDATDVGAAPDAVPASGTNDEGSGGSGRRPVLLAAAAAIVVVLVVAVVVLVSRGGEPDDAAGAAGPTEREQDRADIAPTVTESPLDTSGGERDPSEDETSPTDPPETPDPAPVRGVDVGGELTIATNAFSPTFASGHLWAPHVGGISVVDPEGLALVGTVPIEGSTETPLEYDNRIWVPNIDAPTLTVLDVDDFEHVLATVPVGNGGLLPVVSNGYMWVPNRFDGTVSRIDPATYAVDTFAVAESFDLLVATPGGVEARRGGDVYQITADGAVSGPATVGDEPEVLHTRDWDWKVIPSGLERIDPDSGEIDGVVDIVMTTAVATPDGLWLSVRGDEPAVVFIDQTTLEQFPTSVESDPDTPTIIADDRVVVSLIQSGHLIELAIR